MSIEEIEAGKKLEDRLLLSFELEYNTHQGPLHKEFQKE